jgi:rubrerythrin
VRLIVLLTIAMADPNIRRYDDMGPEEQQRVRDIISENTMPSRLRREGYARLARIVAAARTRREYGDEDIERNLIAYSLYTLGGAEESDADIDDLFDNADEDEHQAATALAELRQHLRAQAEVHQVEHRRDMAIALPDLPRALRESYEAWLEDNDDRVEAAPVQIDQEAPVDPVPSDEAVPLDKAATRTNPVTLAALVIVNSS